MDKTPDQIKPETDFVQDLGADSLDTVELVMCLEEEFEVTIPDEDADTLVASGVDRVFTMGAKTSEIAEFIREYKGEGIQHLAMATEDIYATVRALRANGIRFLSTPDTYYEKVDVRVPNHEERVEDLRELSLLIDGGPDQGVLLQIFTETVIGPIFFEIIQRKGNDGFGEGNFKALFESIEEDQIRRGVLDAD